jgi:hypothetical protein
MAQSPNAAHEALLGVSKSSESFSHNGEGRGGGGGGGGDGSGFATVSDATSLTSTSTSITTAEVTDEDIKREVDRLTSYGTLSRVTASGGTEGGEEKLM